MYNRERNLTFGSASDFVVCDLVRDHLSEIHKIKFDCGFSFSLPLNKLGNAMLLVRLPLQAREALIKIGGKRSKWSKNFGFLPELSFIVISRDLKKMYQMTRGDLLFIFQSNMYLKYCIFYFWNVCTIHTFEVCHCRVILEAAGCIPVIDPNISVTSILTFLSSHY